MALVIYEWKDINYLGAEQSKDSLAPKQYICTSKAVSAGQCSLDQLGGFITTNPKDADSTIYTTPLRFGSGGSGAVGIDGHVLAPGSGDHDDDDGLRRRGLKFDRDMFPHVRIGRAGAENVEGTTHKLPGASSGDDHKKVTQEGEPLHDEASEGWAGDAKPDTHTKVDEDGEAAHSEAPSRVKVDNDGDAPHNEAPHGGEVDDNPNVDGEEAPTAETAVPQTTEDTKGGTSGTDKDKKPAQAAEPDTTEKPDTVDEEKEPVKPPTPVGGSAQIEGKVKQYTEPIHYEVPKTGYYCVGVVPVTLVKGDQAEQHERRVFHEDDVLDPRASNQRGSYEGVVTFRNQFQGELPAAEYPKIAVSLVRDAVTDASSMASSALCTLCSHAGGATFATSTTGSCCRCSGTSAARLCSS